MEKMNYYWKRIMSETEVRNYWKELGKVKKVLDLGCSKGYLGKYKPQGAEVYGLDVDSGAVKEAGKYETAKVFDFGSGKKLPFTNNSFDAIFAKDVFEHLVEPWKLMAECYRVLKKGGVILAVVPSPSAKAWDDYTHVRPFTKRAIEELFLDNGFQIGYTHRTRGVYGFGYLGLSPYVHYFLEIPIFRWLTQGFEVKAVKK